jgi:hypothetical protein
LYLPPPEPQHAWNAVLNPAHAEKSSRALLR